MDDFLLIVSEVWIELENAPAQFESQGVDLITLTDQVQNQDWFPLSGVLEELGFLGNNEVILNARLINTAEGEHNYRFWYIRA